MGLIFDKPPTPSCHASTIVEVDKGQLLAAWFGGKDEGAKDVQIYLTRFDGEKWGKPEVVGTEPGQPTWNPVLFRTKKKTLHLWYKAGPNPMSWTGYRRSSTDDGKTWSKPAMLPAGFYGPVRAKPIQVGATILAGTSLESHNCWTPYVDLSTDDGVTWTRSSPFGVDGKFSQIQPTLFDVPGGWASRVVALMRSKDPRKVCRAESLDGGKTWTPAEPTELLNPSSGIDAVRTGPEEVFLIYNPSSVLRTPISLARSTDSGKTWKKVLDLETEVGEFSYPAMIFSEAEKLEITYTFNRKHIKHATVDPAKLRN
jgi:predicted neuraminidase